MTEECKGLERKTRATQRGHINKVSEIKTPIKDTSDQIFHLESTPRTTSYETKPGESVLLPDNEDSYNIFPDSTLDVFMVQPYSPTGKDINQTK